VFDTWAERRRGMHNVIVAGVSMEVVRGEVFGDNDAFVIIDAPDHATIAAASLVITVSGAVRTKTVLLLTPEEIDQAAKKEATYQAPGH
jgi:uncharacterized protein with GYD domain